jgi:LysM domain-containing protein
MRQKFSIASFVVALAAAILVWGAGVARAADIEVKEGVPNRYTVQKGDTLWGIAGKFLKDPWRWPDVWRMNRDQIRNPHLIYPGDVIVLDRAADGGPRLSLERPTVRLSPSVRSTPIDAEAIASIPAGDIEPYLTRPLITGPNGLEGAAQIIAGRDDRYSRGDGDVAYVVGIDPKAGDLWSIYRQGREFRSIETNELLGVEQRYLGTAKVERYAEVSTLRIAMANEEVLIGDRLIPAPRGVLMNYAPHSPGRPMDGRIIALNRDATEAGRGWIVTLDKGTRDGLDIGTVLAVYRVVAPIEDPRPSNEPEQIDPNGAEPTRFFRPVHYLRVPDERSGLVFVFRVFDRVSYAILLNTTDPVFVGDYVRTP